MARAVAIEDEINAWVYESSRGRPVAEILDEISQQFQQILAVVESLPDDGRMARLDPAYYLLWIGDKRFLPGELFDHFHDDHEVDVRAWMARQPTTAT